MKRNLNVDLLAIDGKTRLSQRTEQKDEATGEVTQVENYIGAANVVMLSLLTPYQGEEIDAKEKVRRATLAERVYKATPHDDVEGSEVEFDMEEGTLILNLVARTYAPLVVMQINRIIEG